MQKIRIGPAGIGPVKDIALTFKKYNELGIRAAEIPFTYQVYIKNIKDAENVKEEAEKNDIRLSIHAPYWINLNSEDKKKIEQSKERILACLKVGTWLKAELVVFHPGYYGKFEKEETYQNIKKAILEIKEESKEKNFSPKLAPETTGKVNVFGSIDEILRLVKEVNCSFCIDFAHILAREKDYKFKEIFDKFKSKQVHIHFSGIDYALKGEKNHKETPESELKKLFQNIPKDREITIINESPYPIEDSIKTKRVFEEFGYRF